LCLRTRRGHIERVGPGGGWSRRSRRLRRRAPPVGRADVAL